MADLIQEEITKGKIKFCRNDVIGKTLLSTIFKGTFEVETNVAVKRISIDLAKLADIDMLVNRTDHENMVKYYCKEEDHDFCYIAMQLCPCNLEEYVEKKGNNKLSLPSTPVEEILRGAAEGLSHIHENNVIHRDIKPSNVLLFVKENKLVAKIRDFEIFRIIPDHQTVLGNFSAGTDLYKAPELLTLPFSWRSDVYAFGLVVFYVLSKGKHLFDNNLGQIFRGNPVNLQELNGQPAALSLVKWLTAFKKEERPRISEVVHHPFFWDDEKKLTFIKEVHEVAKDERNAFLKEVIEEDSHHVICSSPDSCGNQRTPPDPATCADWTCSLTPLVKADCLGKGITKVNAKSCAELVRIIRNKLTHFHDHKEAVKAEYGGNIEGFRRYWLDRFPSLVVHLWEKVEITHLATLFSGYYAPESVRRTNVEATLRLALDEGELGEPEELLNKVKRLGRKVLERALRSAAVKRSLDHIEVLLKDGNPVNLKEPTTLSLFKWLTDFDQQGRPTMEEMVQHPYFWDDEKKLNFIREVHHVAQDKRNAFLKEVMEEHSHHVICSSPDSCGSQQTPDPTVCADWTSSLTKEVRTDCSSKVNTKSCAELVRIIRNKLSHFYSLEEAIKAEYGGNIEGFRRYWLKRFPSLVVYLWEKVEVTHLATTLFKKYYASESVRRTNLEKFLLQTIDKRTLEDPQKLLNQVKRLGSTLWERALSSAVLNGRIEYVKVVLEEGTGPNVKYNIYINNPDFITDLLRCTMRKGFVEVAELLIKGGAEVNCKDKGGWTPLHRAASKGYSSVAKLLIERGAEVNCKNNDGHTSLHLAVFSGHTEIAKLLIKGGADVNCKDEDGKTPLHEAASKGHLEVAKLLIELGAEVSCKNSQGNTPLDCANEKSDKEMIDLLHNLSAESLPAEPNK